MSLLPGEIKGLDRLRDVAEMFFGGHGRMPAALPALIQSVTPFTLTRFRPEFRPRIVPNGHRRTLFFAGKGGVGKTVASCLTAVWLARHGYRTLLLTTDPAAHLVTSWASR